MRHTRAEVIKRAIQEFETLDDLVNKLSDQDWNRLVARSETKDQWTVKDALAHITYWKAEELRKLKRQSIPPDEKGLSLTDWNRLIYERWKDRSPQQVLAWHKQIHKDVLAALQTKPEEWFSSRERRSDWPFELEGHSMDHRVKDIEQALKKSAR
jgi:hypothetical protein